LLAPTSDSLFDFSFLAGEKFYPFSDVELAFSLLMSLYFGDDLLNGNVLTPLFLSPSNLAENS